MKYLLIIPFLLVTLKFKSSYDKASKERNEVVSQINLNCKDSIKLIKEIKDKYYSFVCNDFGFEFYKKEDGSFVGFWENTQEEYSLYEFNDKLIFSYIMNIWKQTPEYKQQEVIESRKQKNNQKYIYAAQQLQANEISKLINPFNDKYCNQNKYAQRPIQWMKNTYNLLVCEE